MLPNLPVVVQIPPADVLVLSQAGLWLATAPLYSERLEYRAGQRKFPYASLQRVILGNLFRNPFEPQWNVNTVNSSVIMRFSCIWPLALSLSVSSTSLHVEYRTETAPVLIDHEGSKAVHRCFINHASRSAIDQVHTRLAAITHYLHFIYEHRTHGGF